MDFSEIVRRVISLAEASDTYWETELPRRHPNYPFVNPGEDSGPPPPEEEALKDLLASLPEEDVFKLALLTHLGRTASPPDDLAELYREVVEQYETPEFAACLMMGKPLADPLVDGLAELERRGIDVDHLTFTPLGSGR